VAAVALLIRGDSWWRMGRCTACQVSARNSALKDYTKQRLSLITPI